MRKKEIETEMRKKVKEIMKEEPKNCTELMGKMHIMVATKAIAGIENDKGIRISRKTLKLIRMSLELFRELKTL